MNAGAVPTWMTEGCIVLMKDKRKGNVVGNYRPFAHLMEDTDLETVYMYTLRSNVWTFEFPGIIAK